MRQGAVPILAPLDLYQDDSKADPKSSASPPPPSYSPPPKKATPRISGICCDIRRENSSRKKKIQRKNERTRPPSEETPRILSVTQMVVPLTWLPFDSAVDMTCANLHDASVSSLTNPSPNSNHNTNVP